MQSSIVIGTRKADSVIGKIEILLCFLASHDHYISNNYQSISYVMFYRENGRDFIVFFS